MKRIMASLSIAFAAISNAQTTNTQTFTAADLVGTWQSAGCEKLEAGAQPAFMRRTFNFTAQTWQITFTLFADPDCNARLLTARIGGPYTLGEAANLERGRKVTWGQTAKFLTPHAPPILDGMNGARCGDVNAALNVEREVSITGCLPFGMPSVKDYGQEYDLLSLRDGKLFTGLRRDSMNLESNRPVALFDYPLVKR